MSASEQRTSNPRVDSIIALVSKCCEEAWRMGRRGDHHTLVVGPGNRELNERLKAVRAALTADETTTALGPREPDNSMVICPNCTCQFVAIPVNIQNELSRLRAFADQFPDDPDIEESSEKTGGDVS